MSAAVLTLTPPPIRPWGGGLFVTKYCTDALILGPPLLEPVTWDRAMAWSASLCVSGRSDWRLPDLAEMKVLVAALPAVFQPHPRWWTRLTCPTSPADAMLLHLVADTETHWGKHCPAWAVAIRHEPLHGQPKQPRRAKPINTGITVAPGAL
jgi:hypothetical protein